MAELDDVLELRGERREELLEEVQVPRDRGRKLEEDAAKLLLQRASQDVEIVNLALDVAQLLEVGDLPVGLEGEAEVGGCPLQPEVPR